MIKAKENIIGWFDIETTSLNQLKGAIIEFGMVLLDKDKYVDELLIQMKPDQANDLIEEQSLSIQGRTLSEVMQYDDANTFLEKINAFFEKHKGILSKQGNKIYPAGHNITSFDLNFLYQWVKRKFNINIFEKYFHFDQIDTLSIVRNFIKWGNDKPKNFKLPTLTNFFGIQHENAHNALGDVKPNIELYYKLIELYKKNH
jgi:DNA polymerase III alpha subunit (gram-positive type)